MFIIKGLLIFLPFFIFRLPFLQIGNRGLMATVLIILTVIIVVSPFSFIGWFLDYLIFFIGITIVMSTFIKSTMKTPVVIIRSLALLSFCGYLTINALFGAKLIEEYKKDGLTFRVYSIPDIVLADTHSLRIDQTWGPFEKTVFNDQVQWSKCTTYDYSLTMQRMFTLNKCN
jgi:hypothetical protein